MGLRVSFPPRNGSGVTAHKRLNDYLCTGTRQPARHGGDSDELETSDRFEENREARSDGVTSSADCISRIGHG